MFRSILQRTAIRQVPRSSLKQCTPITRRQYTSGKPSGAPSIPAMLAVASMGFAAYYTLVKSREGQALPRRQQKPNQQEEPNVITKDTTEKEPNVPAFTPDEVTVVFVLGGPGAGKGTQCDRLKKDYDFVHLSAGDLLREEQNREGSKYGELIKHYIKEGLIVPMEVTIALLEQAMRESIEKDNKRRFLIDGFPRKMDQALKFEEAVVPSKMVLYFECPEQVMLERLLKRGENSGRADDNIESIKKRFRVFKETSFPVIEAFEKENKVQTVSCVKPVDEVYKEVCVVFDKMFEK
ncbi:adenylate kinase-domain-containing protein [Halteromyces radiatus]|uniref:adenylate kinase-domain-containing protein n=1 Tax=Halteromyces radiatus TaxID=101107 RepID=UPI00222069AC|nr:adenylate kinase-domain-containing protein [Halteromyces radiatus]KAI8089638.1 adenylate kinase-domain-containing protein [Halteromyces radiatus]